MNFLMAAIGHHSSLKDRRQKLYEKLFKTIVSNSDHKLYQLLLPKHNPTCNMRRECVFDCPTIRTNRFRNSYISAMSNNLKK